MQLRKHFFPLTLGLLALFFIAGSFFRFMIVEDYLVTYEGSCDPEKYHCYIGCEDDACEETYYYAQVDKYAPTLKAQCGPNITDCEAANACIPGEDRCLITYCDPILEGSSCETIAADPRTSKDSSSFYFFP